MGECIYEISLDGSVIGYEPTYEEALQVMEVLTDEERERAEIQALPVSSLLLILSDAGRYAYEGGGIETLVQYLTSMLHDEWMVG